MVSPEDSGSSGSPKSRRKPDAVDVLPPHDEDAEHAILGCIMLSPRDSLHACFRARLSEATLYAERSRAVMESLIQCHELYGEDFDALMIQDELRKAGKSELVGGLAFLATLPDKPSNAANIGHYIEIVRDKFTLRKLIQACDEAMRSAMADRCEVTTLLDSFSSSFKGICSLRKPSEISVRDTLETLFKIDLNDKTDLLLGNFWLERGSSLVIAAPSGIGKSVLEMQMAVLWALGRQFMGVAPSRPLKSVIVYAENSRRENALTLRSIIGRLGIVQGSKEWKMVTQNVVMRQCYHASGDNFVAFARMIAEEEKPDIMWLDPLAAYVGDDLSKATTIASFLREGLDVIAKDLGFAWIIINHTTKPSNDKARGKTSSDRQHGQAGSYDLMGWSRAGIIITEHSNGSSEAGRVFSIEFTKRSKEAESRHKGEEGQPSAILWARHAHDCIFWEQIDPPEYAEPQEKKERAGRPSVTQDIISIGLGPVIDSMSEPIGKNEVARRIKSYAAKHNIDPSLMTCKKVVEVLLKNRAILYSEATGYTKAT